MTPGGGRFQPAEPDSAATTVRIADGRTSRDGRVPNKDPRRLIILIAVADLDATLLAARMPRRALSARRIRPSCHVRGPPFETSAFGGSLRVRGLFLFVINSLASP